MKNTAILRNTIHETDWKLPGKRTKRSDQKGRVDHFTYKLSKSRNWAQYLKETNFKNTCQNFIYILL